MNEEKITHDGARRATTEIDPEAEFKHKTQAAVPAFATKRVKGNQQGWPGVDCTRLAPEYPLPNERAAVQQAVHDSDHRQRIARPAIELDCARSGA